LASVDTLGQPAAGLYRSPRLDASGKRVAFASTANTLTTNAIASGFNLHLRDLSSNSTTLLNQNGTGEPVIPSGSTELLLNADGNLACFDAALADDSARMPGSYVVCARSVDAPKTEIVSPHADHQVPQTPSGYSGVGTLGVNSNGTRVVFVSHAPDLVESDTNMAPDVFVRDLVNATNLLVSVNSNGFPANNLSIEPTMSADGRFIAFTSTASDIVPGHSNLALNVFLRDMATGTNRIVSTGISNGLPGTANSYAPVLSKDGTKLVFFTEDKGVATNISYSGSASALVFCDLERNGRVILSSKWGAAGVPSFSLNAQRIAFHDRSFFTPGPLVVWDSSIGTNIFRSVDYNIYLVKSYALDPTGRRLVFATNNAARKSGAVDCYEVSTGLHRRLGDQSLGGSSQFKFSADGEKLVYFGLDTPTVGTNNQIFLYDFQQQTNLVLTRPEFGIPAESNNELPDISADGRFVAFRSCTPDATSPRSQITCKLFLHDLATGSMTELSRGTGACIGAPQFSGDGKTLFYTQRISGNNDFNQTVDVFGVVIDTSNEVPLFHTLLAPTPGGWLLTWPVVTGKTYSVEFKNSLDDPNWTTLEEGVVIEGNQGRLLDSAASQQRYYRVVAH
jgi:Tol biopolymer transport system component